MVLECALIASSMCESALGAMRAHSNTIIYTGQKHTLFCKLNHGLMTSKLNSCFPETIYIKLLIYYIETSLRNNDSHCKKISYKTAEDMETYNI